MGKTKIKYVGTQPIAVMSGGYSGIVDHGDIIEVDSSFFDEIFLSKKWKKVVEEKKIKSKEQK